MHPQNRRGGGEVLHFLFSRKKTYCPLNDQNLMFFCALNGQNLMFFFGYSYSEPLLSTDHIVESSSMEIEDLLQKVGIIQLSFIVWGKSYYDVPDVFDPKIWVWIRFEACRIRQLDKNEQPWLSHVSNEVFNFLVALVSLIYWFQLTSLNDKMATIDASGNRLVPHTLQRHREILQDYSSEYKKTVSNYKARKEKEELLDGVQKDLEWVLCFLVGIIINNQYRNSHSETRHSFPSSQSSSL